ncbi:hypothetical protein KBB96_11170 [Luteolibacter ambystomatis]|uniref:Two pore domain potassium channel family protein n=1 Tax=Luteolibacter ambystomatis TaxID=2824561 RepID=A0A975G612_9BACT|nr:hypothetical protein [Luteolibacter ambystomatis]QUE49433.1 hypothetical protein KBB96_11170 [Luteolibacter ambystomatis]
MFRYEHRRQRPISRTLFLRRMLHSVAFAFGSVAVALFVGMLGYHVLEGLPWVDSFLNASMILGGMGPVDPMKTEAGKIFAGLYALFSGLGFIGLAGLLFLPVAHRLLHKFHYEDDEKSSS